MADQPTFFEEPKLDIEPDPDEVPIKDRKVITQPYDLVVGSLMEQIKNNTMYLRPLSERPNFQRRYVWPDKLASRLIESILLRIPIPPCYLSQNENYELDVIDGQQRIYSIYRFLNNEFQLTNLEVLKELNGQRYHEIPSSMRRQISTHTLRCIVITNESHPEIKFDVFERLNTNTMPLNAQELRNCTERGNLIWLLEDVVKYEPWLNILNRKTPDKRMRDEEMALRFFAFYIKGIDSYHTPQKHWLNEVAREGRNYSEEKINELKSAWEKAINISLIWFNSNECFRRLPIEKSKAAPNKSLFDLIMWAAVRTTEENARKNKTAIRKIYVKLLNSTEGAELQDLISRAVDHTKRTKRRFEIWEDKTRSLL